ncbi:MAG: hypothetical protein WCG10_01125 [Chlamydiota bacterium]
MSVNFSINNKYTHEDFEKIQNPYFQKEDNCAICLTSNVEAECKKVELVCRHVFCEACFIAIPLPDRAHCAICRQTSLLNRYFFKEEGSLQIQTHGVDLGNSLDQRVALAAAPGLRIAEELLSFEESPLELWESRLNRSRGGVSRRALPIGRRSLPLASVVSLLAGDMGI